MDHRYFDLSVPGEPRERTTYFVLDSLLRSRIDCGFESNTARYDEDVNVYLADLLASLIRSPGFDAAPGGRGVDVFEQVRDVTDPRQKSRVYRKNADRLLVATSLFVDSPYVEREGRRDFETNARDRIGRGKAYYRWAALFHERAPAGSRVYAHILQLLSEDFERWVDVLFHMRGEYFHLYEHLRERYLVSLGTTPEPDVGPEPDGVTSVEERRDEFLDAYWSWQQDPTAAARARLQTSVEHLTRADPTFRFDLPQ